MAIFVVNALVVSTFSLLGERDVTGVLQLYGASAASAGGSAVAAVGSFAVIGNLFGILTVFQLLELANPSQPLLRRLLIETPGTYHHSIMVGNLAERAAEAIGADPLITSVAAYYHDVGKLANPHGVHREPERRRQRPRRARSGRLGDDPQAARRRRNRDRLPGPPAQAADRIHSPAPRHGACSASSTRRRARRPRPRTAGSRRPTAEKAADAVDQRTYRHNGPKPQTREAALLMLADGVEASVRSLSSRDEPAIRAMVNRIIEDRLQDGQFDECDLTLRDLERIREAFVAQLLGMYHQRIAYPQSKVVELEARRAAAGGRLPGSGGPSAMGPSPSRPPRSIYLGPWRIDITTRAGRAAAGFVTGLARLDRGSPGRRPGRRAGLDRADPDRRRRAGRPERQPHGQGWPDRRAVVSAAAARGVPGPPGAPSPPGATTPGTQPGRPSPCRRAGGSTSATSSSRSSERSSRPRPAEAARPAMSAGRRRRAPPPRDPRHAAPLRLGPRRAGRGGLDARAGAAPAHGGLGQFPREHDSILAGVLVVGERGHPGSRGCRDHRRSGSHHPDGSRSRPRAGPGDCLHLAGAPPCDIREPFRTSSGRFTCFRTRFMATMWM